MSSEQLLKIGDVAIPLGVTTQTLRNWTNSGFMDAVIGKGGHGRFRRSEVERMVELNEREGSVKKCLLYCRVSTSIQKENIERQIERLTSFALSNGFIIEGIYKDIASGMNFKRRGLLKFLDYCQQHRVNTVFIEYKDRLARLGVNLLKEFLNSFGTELMIVNATDSDYKQEIIDDMIVKHSGITSFKTAEVMKKTLQVKHVMNSVTSEQPDNLKAGLSSTGKVDNWNKFWNFIENYQFL